ncbi:MAG: dihydrolipoamide acetyltransferase family protein [Polyangiaceae bacterium]|jgi:pyruvate dehydrogenase E2 component (dihydrolipoamide acetyltransferase)
MARWEFTLPDIGEGVTEGEIVTWLVQPGDRVTEDQPVVEVMTDKATVTITAPKAGLVTETRGRVGQIVAVHSVLVVFQLDGSSPSPPRPEGHANGRFADEGRAATAVGDILETLPGTGRTSPKVAAESEGSRGIAPDGYFNEKPLATPATRKFARDMHVDLRHVPPQGSQGRVSRQDVETFLRAATPAQGKSSATGHAAGQSAAPLTVAPLEERLPFAGLRRKIAQKMSQSKSSAAHFTFVEECNASDLRGLRDRLQGPAAAAGVKLNFLPFIVKAVVSSLKKHPMLNTTLDEAKSEIVLRKYYNIGIATATPAGLVVPVIKDADRKGLLDIARDLDRLASDARTGAAKLEDLQGSTFTITSLGAQGGLLATPIINFPEVAILGVHQMKRKPVVKDGSIVIGDVMLLSLSFDHRIVDGHVGAAFAYEVIGYLERPETLFLEMA